MIVLVWLFIFFNSRVIYFLVDCFFCHLMLDWHVLLSEYSVHFFIVNVRNLVGHKEYLVDFNELSPSCFNHMPDLIHLLLVVILRPINNHPGLEPDGVHDFTPFHVQVQNFLRVRLVNKIDFVYFRILLDTVATYCTCEAIFRLLKLFTW